MRFQALFRPALNLLALTLLAGPGISVTASAADVASIAAVGNACKDTEDFVCVDTAFKVSAIATAPDRIEVTFQVRPGGFYLYRNKMKFTAAEGQPAALGTPDLPAGKVTEDEFFGKQEIYQHDVTAKLPVSRGSKAAFTLPIKVSYQGCDKDTGICYPPQTKEFNVEMPEATSVSALPAGSSADEPYVSKQDQLANLIRSGNVFVMAGAFFLAGLLLSFTPCVLPMVPIVAGIIAGEGANVTRARAFSMSAAYVLGMAATYTAAGVAFAAAGQQAQTLFQQPWIILLFSTLFVAMALSMFGFYTVQMPSFIQTRLTQMSNQQKAGSYIGVAAMGALSALIVTTCVGPALVAALSVIGQSGQMVRGGIALFSMAIGMGMPLLVVGASAGQLLPRAGAWMDTVKQVFGALMLAVAVWMLSRILPERVSFVLWILPLAALAIILLRAAVKSPGARLAVRLLGAVAGVYAALILIGAVRGATDPLQPLRATAAHVELPFQRIKSLDDLNAQVAAAKGAGKTVMLDFYADWCVSCKEMEKYTFPTPVVRAALANTVWLQADVTANDDADQALLKHFGIFGPPTIVFYGTDGAERHNFRVVGFMKAAEFASLASRALK
ncbi:MAG: protein-disulfide reductase DsbD [Steroidobacteraceae bacterium]